MLPVKKFARTLLFQFPSVYDQIMSQRRYRALYALRLVHERDFRALPEVLVKRCPLVLDVGANIGQSILSIYRVIPSARVISFEPNTHNLPDLMALRKKFPTLEIAPYGLGQCHTSGELYWPEYRSKTMSTLASFNRDEAEGWINPSTVYFFRHSKLRIRHSTYEIKPLDDLNLDPDFIKIDVQGLESSVVKGGLNTIERSMPAIMAEAVRDGDPACQQLAQLGYSIWHWTVHGFARGSGPLNSFLLAPQHCARLRASPRPRLGRRRRPLSKLR